MAISVILNALLLAALLTISHGMLKWVSLSPQLSFLESILSKWLVVSGAIFIYVFIFFYYIYVLRGTAINTLYPTYTGLSIIFVFVMGVFVFSESTKPVQVLGCLFIVAGILMVNTARQ